MGNQPRLGDMALRLTSCDAQRFLGSQAALWRGLPKLARAIRTRFQNLCRIEIRMVHESAGDARELGLAASTFLGDMPASGACLRGISGRNLSNMPAGPRQLVAQALDKSAPAGVQDAPVQAGLLPDIAPRLLDGANGTCGHALNMKLLNDDCAVALGVGGAEIVNEVLALPPHLVVDAGDASLGLVSVLGSFLFLGEAALSAREALHGVSVEFRRLDESAVAVGDDIDNTTIERDHWFDSNRRLDDLYFARNRREPLVAVAANGACLRLSFQRPMNDGADATELRKADSGSVNPPDLRMWLSHTETIAPLSFPVWSMRNPLEASLPSLVELIEELGADVSWDVSEPRKLGAELCELHPLTKRCGEDSFVLGTSETHEALLVGQVPQEAQRGLPRRQTRCLLGGRVDTVLEALAYQQREAS
jgi:hypothetical protein